MPEASFPFSTIVTVRFGDMDAMGHVNNAKFLTYFEEARLAYFWNLFPSEANNLKNLNFILAEVTVRFRAPAKMGDRIEMFVKVSDLGTKSFRMDYKGVNVETGASICEGSSVQVMYDYKTGVTIPIPDEMRNKYQSFEQG